MCSIWSRYWLFPLIRLAYRYWTTQRIILLCPVISTRARLFCDIAGSSNAPSLKMQGTIKAWSWKKTFRSEVGRERESLHPGLHSLSTSSNHNLILFSKSTIQIATQSSLSAFRISWVERSWQILNSFVFGDTVPGWRMLKELQSLSRCTFLTFPVHIIDALYWHRVEFMRLLHCSSTFSPYPERKWDKEFLEWHDRPSSCKWGRR